MASAASAGAASAGAASGAGAFFARCSACHCANSAFVTAFSRALEQIVAQPEVRKGLTDLGLTVGYMSPRQLEQRERAYTRAWSRIIRDSGFQPQ